MTETEMKPAKNEKQLQALVKLISRRYLTAAQIADRMGCAKRIAYQRLSVLEKRGVEFEVRKIREGQSGPLSSAYRIRRSDYLNSAALEYYSRR